MVIGDILLLIAGFSVCAGIWRWVFRVNDHLANQEVIIQLLGNLLKQNGMKDEEIFTIMNPKRKK